MFLQQVPNVEITAVHPSAMKYIKDLLYTETQKTSSMGKNGIIQLIKIISIVRKIIPGLFCKM